MNYIVFDLEWNQCPDGREGKVEHLPFEIMEIGAVKLDEDFREVGEFHRLIRPQVYPELHYKIYLGDFYDKENENLNYENYGLWFYDTDGSESYRNAVFPEGTELEVDDGDLILTPSGSVKNQNYDSFYDMYRYRSQ